MSIKDNKALARRWFGYEPSPDMIRQMREAKDPKAALEKLLRSLVEQVWAPDCVAHSPEGDANRERIVKNNVALGEAFPDVSFIIDTMVAEGDMVAIRGRMQGTNIGSYNGMPPTGKKIEMGYISVCRIAGGKVVESWRYSDTLGMMQQLGIIPKK
jgi:predicted ester cyclase